MTEDIKNDLYRIWEFLSVRDEVLKADAIFVMGGSSLEPIRKGAELYKQGLAPYVAFISAGGVFGGQDLWGMPDAQKYEQELLKLGLTPEHIIKDVITTNTLEEAKEAIPFLEAKIGPIHKLIIVSRPFHQRRTWATFVKQHPEVEYINVPGDERFSTDDATAIRLVQEIERLGKYALKGDITTQDIPEEVRFAMEHVKNYLVEKGSYQE